MNIIWPIISKKNWSKYSKDGVLDGVSFKKLWRQCIIEANKYVGVKFPDICKEAK